MDYAQAYEYITHTLPAYERSGAVAFNPGLDRIRQFCAAIGNPQDTFKTIHIGGTNGKGSTCHMLAAILQEAGYKTGLHSSPHMRKFTERAKINGQNAPDEALVRFVTAYRSLIEEIGLSYYEMSVAFAFDYFAREKVDIALIEVGMGGKLDATNIITPLFSLITNISADHLHIIGPTLQDAAREKAGIIKPATPVIISQRQSAFAAIFTAIAQERNAPISFASDLYCAKDKGVQDTSRLMDLYQDTLCIYPDLVCDLAGQYQRHNLPGVFAAIDLLQTHHFTLGHDTIRRALAHVCALSGFSGRWQIIDREPLIVADGAHNIAGITETVTQIAATPHTNLYAILGCVKGKDLTEFLSPWPHGTHMIFSQANLPRALEASILAAEAKRLGFSATIIPNVNEAVEYARQKADKDDMIFIGGSLYLLSELSAL